ncbi:DUF1877 domain-containing protein [Streptomyces mirabilis]|uniref:DUF1877 domain-containing protein n=1 Tax=Streptomyces mirabilis TaxID=68239 RepID=UPI0036CBAC24
MSAYLRLRAVPRPALRNSAIWLERLFEGDAETVRHCRDLERIYASAPPYFLTPLLVLTAARARQVAGFLATADIEALWDAARDELLSRYGGVIAEPGTWGAFAAAHRELRAFYVQTAECGDAVVKWLSEA